ncbi:MAG: DUF2752 domain-containing protein [Verrucomicrobia bacterium]|nr:DUF2752 domain-containing protein [Verrucomicrobiota bacterium]
MNPDPSINARRSRAAAPITIGVWLLGGGGLAAVLYWFDPALGGIYPVCLFHRLTGWQCPGCGGLRALHQLLHGHWAEAARLNALLVVALPFFAWFGARQFAREVCGLEPGTGAVRPVLLWIWLGAAVLFSVARNLPFLTGGLE